MAGSRIVCDSHDVFSIFQTRIPSLARAENIVFLDSFAGRSGFVFAAPRPEFSPVRILRLSLILGALLSCAMVFANSAMAARPAGEYWIGAAAGLVVGIGAQIWLASFSWQAWPFLLAAQWVTGIFLLRHAPMIPLVRLTNAAACAAAMLAISLAVFLVRLDFDGDVFTHWLPMARSFYHLGHHDPSTLLAQGSTHAATYPPGYGIFLAMTMWAVDMGTTGSYLPGADSSLAILYYRLAIWVLNMAFFGLLAGYFIRQSPPRSWLWLAGLALVTGAIPTLRGTHVAAETLLFPLLGSALVLFVASSGRPDRDDEPLRMNASSAVPFSPALALAGIAIAGSATLLKCEVPVLVSAVFAPWFLVLLARTPKMRSPHFLATTALIGAASIAPTIIWKAGLHIENDFFQTPSLAALWNRRAEWFSLLIAAVTFLLKSPLWIPLFLLLPAGWILGIRQGFQWSGLLIPAATALLFFAFVSMYLFSNWPTKILHVEQSLDRLSFLSAFSCILYFLENLIYRRRKESF